MKKLIILIIITVFAVSSLSAFGKKEDKQPASAQQNIVETPKEFNDIKMEGLEITGIVEKGFKNMICIIENPSSKSRVSYYPDKEAAEKLEKILGKTVTVIGDVKETNNPFKKEIKVLEIKK